MGKSGGNQKFKNYFGIKQNKEWAKPREYSYPTLLSPEDLDYEDKRILIIGGDPGIGKTALAITVAKHWQYHPEILNVNEESNIDNIINRISFATQNQSLNNFSDKSSIKKPTCLIIDGVDPEDSTGKYVIKILESYIRSGKIKSSKKIEAELDNTAEPDTHSAKFEIQTSNSSSKRISSEIKRPIILICKNIYDRNLIDIKKLGLTFKIRKPDSKKLLNRLIDILNQESVHIDSTLLKKMIIETNYDISSCLNILQYITTNLQENNLDKFIEHNHLFDQNNQFRFKKDIIKSTFDTWEKIMRVNSKFDK